VQVALASNLTVVCWDGAPFRANMWRWLSLVHRWSPILPYLAEQPHEIHEKDEPLKNMLAYHAPRAHERMGDMSSRLLGQSCACSACMKCVIGATAFEILQVWTCREGLTG